MTSTTHSLSFVLLYNNVFQTNLYHSTLFHDKWVPVATAWRVLRLRVDDLHILRVAAYIYRISSRGQPTRGGLQFGRLGDVLTTNHRKGLASLRGISQGLGPGQTLCSIQGQVAGACGCGNEPSGSKQCEEFLDQLRTC